MSQVSRAGLGPVEEPDRFLKESGPGDRFLGLPKPLQGHPGGLVIFGTGLHHSQPGEAAFSGLT